MKWRPERQLLYKWLDATASYSPGSPWYSPGRFGSGEYKTLYLAYSAQGAMAEYFRRHPEFLDFQDDLLIELFEITLDAPCECLDVRDSAKAVLIGIGFDRLLSSEPDDIARYAECRALGKDAVNFGLCGLAYPSAALSPDLS